MKNLSQKIYRSLVTLAVILITTNSFKISACADSRLTKALKHVDGEVTRFLQKRGKPTTVTRKKVWLNLAASLV